MKRIISPKAHPSIVRVSFTHRAHPARAYVISGRPQPVLTYIVPGHEHNPYDFHHYDRHFIYMLGRRSHGFVIHPLSSVATNPYFQRISP